MVELGLSMYSFPLSLLYLLLALIVFFQLSRIWYYRHNRTSFQFGFLFSCFLLSTMRGVYFLFIMEISKSIAAYAILYWLPFNVQFATFSLLVLWFAHSVKAKKWASTYRVRYIVAYMLSNSFFLTCAIVGITLDIVQHDPEWVVQAMSGLVSTLFLILVFILAWYGLALARYLQEKQSQVSFQLKSLKTPVLIMTSTIFVIFLSRSIFDLLTTFKVLNVSNNSSHDSTAGIIAFCAYFVWEIVPTSFVVFVFWKIPKTGIAGLRKRAPPPPEMFSASSVVSHDSDPLLQQTAFISQTFSNPSRYDSDEEGPRINTPPSWDRFSARAYSTTPVYGAT